MASTFMVHMFLISPATKHFLNPQKYEKQRGLLYAITFLVLVAALTVGYELRDTPPNYYAALGVDRRASDAEIDKAYRRLSKEKHPDKNTSPTANEEFIRLQRMKEVLTDPQLRQEYELFGELGIEGSRKGKSDDITSLALVNMGVYYGIWMLLTYFLTSGPAFNGARMWSMAGLLVLAMLEYKMKISRDDPFKFLTQTPVFEKVDWLHRLYPPFMNGCRIISMSLFVDVDQIRTIMLNHLVLQQRDMLRMLQGLQQQIARLTPGDPQTGEAFQTETGTPETNEAPQITELPRLEEAPPPPAQSKFWSQFLWWAFIFLVFYMR